MTSPFGRRALALASILTVTLAAGACEYNESNGHGHGRGRGQHGGRGTCYERVLHIDKKTGQTHYENRAIPCPK